jgi:hypothetical protein
MAAAAANIRKERLASPFYGRRGAPRSACAVQGERRGPVQLPSCLHHQGPAFIVAGSPLPAPEPKVAVRGKWHDTGPMDGSLMNLADAVLEAPDHAGLMLWPAPCYHDGNGASRTQPNSQETS